MKADTENLVRRILERPPLAALLVGTFINLFLMASTWLLAGQAELMARLDLAEKNPLYFSIQIAIPYLIPWIVTTISLQFARQRMQLVLNKFPEMNPDIIMRLDTHRKVEYLNQAGQDFMRRHQMPIEEPLQMLPKKVLQRLCDDHSIDLWLSVDVRHNEQTINFNIRRDDEGNTFIAGRDISRAKKVQDRLDAVTIQLGQLTEFLDRSLADYNQLNFDLFGHMQLMLSELLDGEPKHGVSPPSSVLVLQRNGHQQELEGYLFQLREHKVFQDMDPIALNTQDYPFARTSLHDKSVCINWDDAVETLLGFQQRFSPNIREKVGTVEGYTIYQSGSTEVIGFFHHNNIDYYDGLVLESVAIIAESLNRISQESQQIQDAFTYTLDALARASEANDEDTGSHIIRLNEYAREIAMEMGLDDKFVQTIHYSAMMHDVGKIHIHPDILKKPGKLTDHEFQSIQSHPIYGARILGDSPRMVMAAEIARYHHEKFNGGGYPGGISGEAIPLSARIVSIVDVYDALRQKRVYKPAFSHEKSLKIITEGDGRTSPDDFDPAVLAAFKAVHEKLDQIFSEFQDD